MIQKVELILECLVAKVGALPQFTGWTPSRDEYQDTPAAQIPAGAGIFFVYPTKDVKENLDEDWDNFVENRVLNAVIALRTTTFPVSSTTLPLLDAICEAIKADKTLGGLALQVRIHVLSWSGSNSGDGPIAAAALALEIIYRTNP